MSQAKTHLIALAVEDKPGVMSRIADAFRRRLINIDTITVGKTEVEGISRIVITLKYDGDVVKQVTKQIQKMIDVIEAKELEIEKSVLRELALIKVRTENLEERSEVLQLVNIFRAQVVDVSNNSLSVQIVGDPDKINAFIDLVRKFNVIEIARTGIVAIERGSEGLLSEDKKAEFKKQNE